MSISSEKANRAKEKLENNLMPEPDEYVSAMVEGLAKMKAVMPLMGQVYPESEMKALEIQEQKLTKILELVETGEIGPEEFVSKKEFSVKVSLNKMSIVSMFVVGALVLSACGSVDTGYAKGSTDPTVAATAKATEVIKRPAQTVTVTPKATVTPKPIVTRTEVPTPTETEMAYPKPVIGDEVLKLTDVEQLPAIEIKSLADWDDYYKNVLGPAEDEYLNLNVENSYAVRGIHDSYLVDGLTVKFLAFNMENTSTDGVPQKVFMCSLTKIVLNDNEEQLVPCFATRVYIGEKDANGKSLYKTVKIHPLLSTADILKYETAAWGSNEKTLQDRKDRGDLNKLIAMLNTGDITMVDVFLFNGYDSLELDTVTGTEQDIQKNWLDGGYADALDYKKIALVSDEVVEAANGQLSKGIFVFH